MKKLIAVLIILIFSFESTGYCLRVPMQGANYGRVAEANKIVREHRQRERGAISIDRVWANRRSSSFPKQYTRNEFLAQFTTAAAAVLRPAARMLFAPIRTKTAETVDVTKLSPTDLLKLLEDRSNDSDPNLRVAAVIELSKRIDPEFIQFISSSSDYLSAVLGDALENDVEVVRVAVAVAMGKNAYLRTDKTILALQAALSSDKSPLVRQKAVWALGVSRSIDAIPVMSKALLTDASIEVMEEAAMAFYDMSFYLRFRIKPYVVGPLIEASLRGQSEKIRAYAIYTLGQLADSRAIEPMMQILKDKSLSGRIRSAASGTIAMLAGTARDGGRNILRDRIEELIDLLADTDGDVRSEIAWALENIPDSRSVSPLIQMALYDTYVNARISAINTLGWMRESQSTAALCRILSNQQEDNRLRKATAWTLGYMGEETAGPTLIMALAETGLRQTAAWALGAIAYSQAAEPLLQLLNDLDPSVRRSAAYALGQIHYPSSLGPLLELYSRELQPGSASDSYMLHTILASIAAVARENDKVIAKENSANGKSYKAIVATSLHLEGTPLRIWNKFGILVMDDSATFTDTKFLQIYRVLEVLPENRLDGFNLISIEAPDTNDGLVGGGANGEERYIVFVSNAFDSWFFAEAWARTLFHEISHVIDYFLTRDRKTKAFDELYCISYDNPDNFASGYGMTNRLEDFAEISSSYLMDSAGFIARVNGQRDKEILLKKIAFMAGLFAPEGQPGYTYVFHYNNDGSITRTIAKLGADGLPILTGLATVNSANQRATELRITKIIEIMERNPSTRGLPFQARRPSFAMPGFIATSLPAQGERAVRGSL